MGFETHMLVWEVERDVGGGLEMLQIIAFRRNGAFSAQLAFWGLRKSLGNHVIRDTHVGLGG